MNDFRFYLITNQPAVASYAIAAGVDRIFVDLEVIGKESRQGHLNTVISRHSEADVAAIRAVVPPGKLMVRINPIHEESNREIGRVLDAGADVVMLPMYSKPADVEVLVRAVAGRGRCCLLLETLGAAETLRECLRVPGVDEVHVGLNDLHLALGQQFMFEPVANGFVDQLCDELNSAGVPFGIGGLARVGEGMLPAEFLLAEHVRLGSTGAILSRTFHRMAASVPEIEQQMDFSAEIRKLREAYRYWLSASFDDLAQQHRQVQQRVADILAAKILSPTGE